MIARAVLILSSGLAAASLWFAAAPLADRLFGKAAAVAGISSPDARPTGPQVVDLGPVLDFAPFGTADGGQPVAAPQGQDSGLILLGITLSQTPGQSRAILAGGDNPTGNYALGDSVRPDTTLTRIQPDHVTLVRAGQELALYFEPGNPGTPPAPQAMMTVADDTALARYRAALQQDAPGLLAQLGLAVTDQGYLVTDAPSVELAGAGLRAGDLITTVNGSPLGDPDTALALFDQIAAAGSASLSVTRDGVPLLMTFPLP